MKLPEGILRQIIVLIINLYLTLYKYLTRRRILSHSLLSIGVEGYSNFINRTRHLLNISLL
jgi:hypothetical protein